ncbi:hypothetical protein Cgig2_001838 [Carnegiea gigantea]|uniref:R13L1/DRL21-like LRR repeat region domain-containing protein n=1 Tax=Carnegiea gigantea TaxID=171969 RepID=A0A9Q1JZC9_9CARY|nr:hypothetical protein Cgig2_001838 [Carnegiea gigantea]
MRFLNSLPMVAFRSLTKMTIYGDSKVENLSEIEEVFRGCSSSLRFLQVMHREKLRSVSRGLKHLAVLESLQLVGLPALRFDETQGEEEEDEDKEDDTTGNDDLLNVSVPWNYVIELPKGMRYLTALQSLKIVNLPLKDVPEWIASLPSLHSLEIKKCKHLESLPEALGNLTSLVNHFKSF